MLVKKEKINLSTNPDVKIHHHEDAVNGSFYYAVWSEKFFDKFGYPLNDHLPVFYIVDDFGVLVEQPDFHHGYDSSQTDSDFTSYYGGRVGAGIDGMNIQYIDDQTEIRNTVSVIKDMLVVGFVDWVLTKEVTGAHMYFFKWEDGTTDCLDRTDVINSNIRFLTSP